MAAFPVNWATTTATFQSSSTNETWTTTTTMLRGNFTYAAQAMREYAAAAQKAVGALTGRLRLRPPVPAGATVHALTAPPWRVVVSAPHLMSGTTQREHRLRPGMRRLARA